MSEVKICTLKCTCKRCQIQESGDADGGMLPDKGAGN